jgi:hypothetical protein
VTAAGPINATRIDGTVVVTAIATPPYVVERSDDGATWRPVFRSPVADAGWSDVEARIGVPVRYRIMYPDGSRSRTVTATEGDG